jgi:ADP-ribosylglycohydrolase
MSSTAHLPDLADRAAGCIVGAFIGDALGLGPHWYYDLEELRRDFGEWIDGYTAPKPGARYHAGMKAGELSQTGIIMLLLLRSIAERGTYDEADFTRRLDEELLPKLDGTAFAGPGGYTNHSIRQVWQARIREGKSWDEAGGNADTSEAAERVSILAACFALDPYAAAKHAHDCCRLSQTDSLVAQQSVAFACVLAALVRGEAFDEQLSDKLMDLVGSGEIPFVAKSSIAAAGTRKRSFGFASPDALLLPSWIAQAAHDPGIRVEPAWKVSLVYGMSCAINFVLPGAYYLAARFPRDFESAVLHAINGGGQNMSRACLTGALVGAQVGLGSIPSRFITGLADGEEIIALAQRVAVSSVKLGS